MLIDSEEYKRMHDRRPQEVMCSGSRDMFLFGEISDNISETVQDRDNLKWKTSYWQGVLVTVVVVPDGAVAPDAAVLAPVTNKHTRARVKKAL